MLSITYFFPLHFHGAKDGFIWTDFNIRINSIWIQFSWLNVSVISCWLITVRIDYRRWCYNVTFDDSHLQSSNIQSSSSTFVFVYHIWLSSSLLNHLPDHLSWLSVSSHFPCSAAMSAFRVAAYSVSNGCQSSVAPGRPYGCNPLAPTTASLKLSCICPFKLPNKRVNLWSFCSLINGRSVWSH